MKKVLLKLSNFIEKIGKQNFLLIIFIIVALGITSLYQTFSLYTSSEGLSILEGIKTFKFILNTDITENAVTISSGTSKNIAITISNHENGSLKYGLYYKSTDDLTNVGIGYLNTSEHSGSDIIETNQDYVITVKIYNQSTEDVTIQFGTIYGVEKGGDLLYEDNQHPLEIIYPYKYQVNYLESTGTQYIDTEFIPNQDTSVEFIAETTKINDTVFWFGSRNNSGATNGQTFSLVQMGDNRFRSDYAESHDYVETVSINPNIKYTIYRNKNITYVDGIEYINTTYSNFTSPSTLTLFATKTYTEISPHNKQDGADLRRGFLKLYSCKIWDDDILIRDYIPVIDWEGRPGLYDKVNDEIYYNEDTIGSDFYTDMIPEVVKVSKNFNVTESTLRNINAIPESAVISDLSIKNSSNSVVESTLTEYDLYNVTYNFDGRSVTQYFAPTPTNSITLTNVMNNSGFESAITDYYNGTPQRSSYVYRSGSYSMYFPNNGQVFLRLKYGNIGAKGKSVYIRVYSQTDSLTLEPLLYVYEMPTSGDSFDNTGFRAQKYLGISETNYFKWTPITLITAPTNNNYEYFILQYAQASGTGSGNVFWDDLMGIVLEPSVWGNLPTEAWLNTMIPDFTGTMTLTW